MIDAKITEWLAEHTHPSHYEVEYFDILTIHHLIQTIAGTKHSTLLKVAGKLKTQIKLLMELFDTYLPKSRK